ncbi:MAG: type II toxin-antitoxin system VapC family toxin [Magnetococcales bacterium]|nr:type II toxin-antitoxin system VapC family toxin [Magnetococcales bacterium]
MITAIDTNILIDILEPCPKFGLSSKNALKLALAEGSVVACDVVWAEVATAYGAKQEELLRALNGLGVTFSPITQNAAQEAVKGWFLYRKSGGTRKRIAADFLIGGHALIQSDRLLTRDQGVFSTVFKSLKILDPSLE